MHPSNGLESRINIVNKDTSANSWIIIGREDKSLSQPSLANNHYSSIVTANTERSECHQKLLINDQQQSCESNKIPECKQQQQQQQPGTRNKQEKTNCCQFCYCFVSCDLGCCPAFSEMSFNSFPLSSSRMVTKKSKCMQNCCYNSDKVFDSGSVSGRIQPAPIIQHNNNSGTDHSIDHSQCQHNLRHYSQQRPNHRPAHYCKPSGSLNNLNSILQSRLRLLWQTSSVIIAHLRTRNHPHHHHNNSRKTRQKTHKKHTTRLKNPIGPPNLNVTSGFVLFVLFLMFVFGLISCTVNATTDFATMQSDDGALLDRANGTSPTEGHQYRHRHSVPITIPNELITAESIYPCLDIFDVVLARPAIDRRLWLSSSHQSDPVVNGSPVSPTVVDQLPPSNQALPVSSNYDQIRQLIRVYWANKEVVDSIQSATAQHLSRKRLYPLLSSHHHHHHHHHHYHHQNHQIPNSRHPQQHPRKYHHLHPHQPLRPSMLIELRQLNYVREYVVPLKSQLVQMRCDQFEPGESLYYCFIRVILSGNAVQYESLPHCVPTMLNVPFNQTNSNSDLTSHHSRINNSQHQTSHSATSKFASNSGSSHSDSSPRDPNESTRKFLNDSPLLNTDETKRETKTELNSLIRPTISILPPGPTFNNLASNSILKNTDKDIHLDKFTTKNDVDIKQFALKSDGDEHPLQLEPQQQNQLSNKKRKVLEQTQFCHCGGGESNENFQTKLQTNKQHNLVRINLTETETMVLHLIITSCSLVDREDYLSEDYNYIEDDYNGDVNYDNHNLNHYYSDDQNARLINSKESTANVQLSNDRSKQSATKTKTRTAQSHALIESDIETSDNSLNQSKDNSINKQQQSSSDSNKRKNKKPNNRQTPQQHKKRRKNKKEKKVAHKLPENNQSSTTTAPGVTSSSTTEIYPEVSSVRSTSPPVTSESSSALDPTICILSMDSPIDYSFKLDSIEPSYDFPLNHLNKAANGFQSTINLIDYLHKFPFLVVRNGQLSIDPRMNIENRSQTHYLRSGHLRLEAISSMNVTIRFRRSVSPLFRPGSPPPPQPPPTGTLNQFKQTKQQQLGTDGEATEQKSLAARQQSTGYLDTFHSITEQIVSFIALKIIDVDQKNARKLKNQNEHQTLNLSSFHLTAIILSLFIAITLLIYAVIALNGRNKRRSLPGQQQISTSIMPTMNSFSDDTPNHSQNRSKMATEKATTVVSIKKFDSSVSSSEQQSLELDYYDYSQPLTVADSSAEATRQISIPGSINNNTNRNGITETVPVMFRTLPIKVSNNNSNNNNNNKLSSNISTFSLDITPNHQGDNLQEDNRLQPTCSNSSNNNNQNVATLTRLSFTKPPILLSTFTRQEES